jgi:bacterioferritin-associated ferredoxin
MHIDRCVCFDVTFHECKEKLKDAENPTFEYLNKECKVGDRCGFCKPYINLTLQTGQTIFTEIIKER